MLRAVIFLVSLGARALRAMCRHRADLVIENLALRQPGDSSEEGPPAATARRRRSSVLGGAIDVLKRWARALFLQRRHLLPQRCFRHQVWVRPPEHFERRCQLLPYGRRGTLS